jgi:CxxC motif-containing protein (DUF1111 family)
MKSKWVKRFIVSDGLVMALLLAPVVFAITAVEAPAGFDDLTNGFTTQTQFDLDREVFEEFEVIDDGLGPVYNAQACRECHQNPVTGGPSQITELRAARLDAFGTYSNPPGGSLINDRAINAAIQERLTTAENVVAIRASLNVLGDGFVEAIPDSEFTRIQNAQPAGRKGQIISVPVLESPGTNRIARFGWKNQHASLLSFSADAYINEMGITSPLQPVENTSNGASVATYDTVPDPEEAATPDSPFGPDVEIFARFMRSTQAPARDPVLSQRNEARQGEQVFVQIGCNQCHTPALTTAPAGTVLNGGTFVVPEALGSKIIHPYSDFLLHDVGTGDGIVQNGGEGTRNKVRTPPLWGLRTRPRLMHDGGSLTRNDAILRHDREARGVVQSYARLPPQQRDLLMAFLSSL